jgi:hypothetical protein
MFDLDGTLVRRAPTGAIPMPGAADLVVDGVADLLSRL